MGNIIKALLLIWELPQNIVGAFLFTFFSVFSDTIILDDDDSLEMYSTLMRGAISLGVFRVYKYSYFANSSQYVRLCRMHEKGHRIQSKILGPFYLIVIGITSIIWNTLHTLCKPISKIDYYWFYPEKWADRLGGVKR